MSTIERRFLSADVVPVTLTERQGDEPRKIKGYAAVFFDPAQPGTEYELWEGTVERIMPGAFTRALREDDVRGLFNHSSNRLLGRKSAGTLRLAEDDRGLEYEIDPPDTQTGRDVVTSLERGDLSGSSFSFEVTDEEWKKVDGQNIRVILGVKLYDVGPVTFPAYQDTTAGVRAEETVEARTRCKAWEAKEQAARDEEEAKKEAARKGREEERRRRLRVLEVAEQETGSTKPGENP